MVTPQEKFERFKKEIESANIPKRKQPASAQQYQSILDQYCQQLKYNCPDKKYLEDFIQNVLQKNDVLLTQLCDMKRDPTVTVEIMNGNEWILTLVKEINTKYENKLSSKAADYFLLQKYKKWQRVSTIEKLGMLKDTIKQFGNHFKKISETIKIVTELTQNVLGQYDNIGKSKIDHKVLRFLTPNVYRIAQEAFIKGDDLLTSVAIHEDTHNRQFTNYPNLENLLDFNIEDVVILRVLDNFKEMSDLTENEVQGLIKEKEDCLQAIMSVVEGHAVLFEEELSKMIIPDYNKMSALLEAWKFARRAKMANYPEVLKKKREQYKKGLKFVREVYDVHKEKTSKLVFENLPNITEIENPKLYLAKF